MNTPIKSVIVLAVFGLACGGRAEGEYTGDARIIEVVDGGRG